jgi:hypothetical protein
MMGEFAGHLRKQFGLLKARSFVARPDPCPALFFDAKKRAYEKEEEKSQLGMKCDVESFLLAVSRMASQISQHVDIEVSLGEQGELQVSSIRLNTRHGARDEFVASKF